jgi:catechol 2,3-dioxygenase-like lactoylglutathione lyase family enzyme
VVGVWHTGLTVRSLERTLAFYCAGLGFEVLSRSMTSAAASQTWDRPGARAAVVFLRVPGSDVTVELFEFTEVGVEQQSAAAPPWDYGSSHLCLLVDDLEAVYARLRGLGHRARSPGVVSIQDGPSAGAKVVYMLDPDSYHVELFQRPAAG